MDGVHCSDCRCRIIHSSDGWQVHMQRLPYGEYLKGSYMFVILQGSPTKEAPPQGSPTKEKKKKKFRMPSFSKKKDKKEK